MRKLLPLASLRKEQKVMLLRQFRGCVRLGGDGAWVSEHASHLYIPQDARGSGFGSPATYIEANSFRVAAEKPKTADARYVVLCAELTRRGTRP